MDMLRDLITLKGPRRRVCALGVVVVLQLALLCGQLGLVRSPSGLRAPPAKARACLGTRSSLLQLDTPF